MASELTAAPARALEPTKKAGNAKNAAHGMDRKWASTKEKGYELLTIKQKTSR
jgi:hypothetical protein